MTLLRLVQVAREYGVPGDPPALAGVTLSVDRGEFVAIEGPSGAGKSTLLNIVGLLDNPTEGEFWLDDVQVSGASRARLAVLRSDLIGLIFQSFHLLESRPVVDSVELGLLYRGVSIAQRRQAALAALEQVGIAHLAHKRARLLSGGERQRVAVARALATGAPILLADEPTGNLDSKNTEVLLEVLSRLHQQGTTVVIVTHSSAVADHASRRVTLVDGQVQSDVRVRKDAPKATRKDPLSRPTGNGSLLRARDLVRDAWAGVAEKAGRTTGVVAAVGVGVGLAVATLGLSFSAAAQVSDTFDARTNRDVSVEWVDSTGGLGIEASIGAAQALNGVDSVLALEDLGGVDIAAVPQRDTVTARAYVATGMLDAARIQVMWSRSDAVMLAQGEALVGATLAESIHLGPLEAQPTIFVDGVAAKVVGLVEESPRNPDMVNGVVVESWSDHSEERRVLLMIRTAVGAARQVASEAPLAIDPYDPLALVVTAPPSPQDLRAEVEGQVTTMLAIMTVVAIVGGFVSLMAAMLLSVGQRTREFGLRRAVGARTRHIAALMTVEAAIIGLLGGALGLVLGLVAVLVTSAANGWIPVFEPWLAPIAVIAGIVLGTLAGLVASRRATGIEPQAALRAA